MNTIAARCCAGFLVWMCLIGCQTTAPHVSVTANKSAEVSAFVEAAGRGDVPAVTDALQNGMDVNATDGSGKNALHKAARQNRCQMVGHLLKNGANPKVADRFGLDALLIACQYGQDDVVRVLLGAGVSPNDINEKGIFPLFIAVAGDYGSTARILLEGGARPDLSAVSNSVSALMFACEKNSRDSVSALLEHGANPNRANTTGWTPLMVAAQYGHTGIVEQLLQHGVDLDAMKDDGLSAFFVAIDRDQMDVARMLARKNAKWSVVGIPAYLTAVGCYLVARESVGNKTTVEIRNLFSTAAGLFEKAEQDIESMLKDKRSIIMKRNLTTSMFVAGSVLLMAATGGTPAPWMLSSESVKAELERCKIRLARCRDLKTQCDAIVARLSHPHNDAPACELLPADLTLMFNSKEI